MLDEDEYFPEGSGPIVYRDGIFQIETVPPSGEVPVDPVLKSLVDSILDPH